MLHGEGTTVARVYTNHSFGDVFRILIFQRLTDEEQFGVAQSIVGKRVGLIRGHDSTQTAVGSVEECCISGRRMGTTMPHGDERAFGLIEKELAQRLYVGLLCLFNVLAGVF